MKPILSILLFGLSILSGCKVFTQKPVDLSLLNGEWNAQCTVNVATPEEIICPEVQEPIYVFEIDEKLMTGTVTEKYLILRKAGQTNNFVISKERKQFTIAFQGNMFKNFKGEIIEITTEKLVLKSVEEDFYRILYHH